MAVGKFQFFSDSLCRPAEFHIVLPNDVPVEMTKENPHFARETKTLLLFHGYNGIATDWAYNARLLDMAGAYNLAIVCPDGENSFYLDGPQTGRKYCTYVGKELPEYVRRTFGLSDRREDTLVGGFSMGGFGALHTGLAYPETFCGIFALSSALIMHEVAGMIPGSDNGVANYDYYRLMFGEPEKLLTSENNPEELVRRICASKGEFPKIFMACGTDDFLLEENRAFHAFLEEMKVPVEYREGEGNHNFAFWNEYAWAALKWLLEEA